MQQLVNAPRLVVCIVFVIFSPCALWSKVAYGATPALTLTAVESPVNLNSSPVLKWTATGVSKCVASGGWSGNKSVDGRETLLPIAVKTTYTLTCSGANGTVKSMVGVSVWGKVTLTWTPPSTRIDGSPYKGADGYRLYYGTDSGRYTDSIRILDPATVESTIRLASDQYYFAITAVDRQGEESKPSNEVTRLID